MKYIMIVILLMFANMSFAYEMDKDNFYRACIDSTSSYPPIPLESDKIFCKCQTALNSEFLGKDIYSGVAYEIYLGSVILFFQTQEPKVLQFRQDYAPIHQRCTIAQVDYLEANPVDLKKRFEEIESHRQKEVERLGY